MGPSILRELFFKKIIPLRKNLQWPFKLPAEYQCFLRSERYYSHLNAYDCYALFHFIYGFYDLLTSQYKWFFIFYSS